MYHKVQSHRSSVLYHICTQQGPLMYRGPWYVGVNVYAVFSQLLSWRRDTSTVALFSWKWMKSTRCACSSRRMSTCKFAGTNPNWTRLPKRYEQKWTEQTVLMTSRGIHSLLIFCLKELQTQFGDGSMHWNPELGSTISETIRRRKRTQWNGILKAERGCSRNVALVPNSCKSWSWFNFLWTRNHWISFWWATCTTRRWNSIWTAKRNLVLTTKH